LIFVPGLEVFALPLGGFLRDRNSAAFSLKPNRLMADKSGVAACSITASAVFLPGACV
jgi:hypothetical protein